MIRVEITLCFPLGAQFHQNPKLLVYKQFLKMVHKITCINTEGNCKDCKLVKQCNYARMTSDYFRGHPGVLVKTSLFDKHIYREGESMDVVFYLIGQQKVQYEYISLFFKEYLRQKLLGNPFYIRSIHRRECKLKMVRANEVVVKTPVECENLYSVLSDMCGYYNSQYDTKYVFECDKGTTLTSIRNVNIDRLYKGFNRGVIGRLDGEVMIPSDFIEIGIGKYNYLGGGKIEIKTNIK